MCQSRLKCICRIEQSRRILVGASFWLHMSRCDLLCQTAGLYGGTKNYQMLLHKVRQLHRHSRQQVFLANFRIVWGGGLFENCQWTLLRSIIGHFKTVDFHESTNESKRCNLRFENKWSRKGLGSEAQTNFKVSVCWLWLQFGYCVIWSGRDRCALIVPRTDA